MNLLVTGAKGFIGKNLIVELRNREYTDIFEYDIDTNPALLDDYCKQADFVFHLAGVNRPKDTSDFMTGNFGFTSTLLDALKKHNNTCPVMISSSIQAKFDNPYGKSKKAGEELLFDYSDATGAKVLVYRFPNVFGKWCKANYNSAVATFCNNIARDQDITINDASVVMNLVYIDDVVDELIDALQGNETKDNEFCEVPSSYTSTLGGIVDLIHSFKNSRTTLCIADMNDPFTKKLYSTYLSYLPKDDFSYKLDMHEDNRGSFTEFIRTVNAGQVSVNVSKPGVCKGEHYHHTKNEKFLVVSGNGVIRFRKIDSDEILEYFVSSENLQVVDIPVGYTHNIENLGDTDMVAVMWCNECFNPEKPDTYFVKVKEGN